MSLKENKAAKEDDEDDAKSQKDAKEKLTKQEEDVVTGVFRSFETGLREGTMQAKVMWQNQLLNQ